MWRVERVGNQISRDMKKERIWTTSDVCHELIAKGYGHPASKNMNGGADIDPSRNSWSANRIEYSEYPDGYSCVRVGTFVPCEDIPGSGTFGSMMSYAKMTAAQKREVMEIVNRPEDLNEADDRSDEYYDELREEEECVYREIYG